MTNLKVVGNRVGVVPLLELVTDWGFALPDNTNEPAIHNEFPILRGVIFGIGETVEAIHELEINQEVLFFNHNRNKVMVDEQQLIIMPVDDIVGVVSENG